MTPKEATNQVVDIWKSLTESLKDSSLQAMAQEQRIELFHEACDFLISANISADNKEARQQREAKPKSDVSCKYCNRPLTVKEKEYCDTHDSAYICYQCSKK